MAAESKRLDGLLAGGLYVVALSLVVLSLFDYLAAVWPFQFGEVSWRYGAFGLVSGFVLTPLIGLSLAILLAWHRQRDQVLRVIGVVAIIGAALLLVMLVGFSLDAVQVWRGAPAETKRLTLLSAAKAVIKIAAAAVAVAWLGLGALRQGKSRSR